MRKVYPVAPPKVEYSLTDEGRSLEPFLLGLCNWEDGWLARRGMNTAAQMKLEREAEWVDVSSK
ncbi:winged helix-turn-helix transcriptional regulator [Pseudomonas marginalis]|uniref:winged helix-turn-helix transcriptional regulator n=1 Tax=Pseudomonas marginalis TaxID=298 RepID=UPI0026C8CF78